MENTLYRNLARLVRETPSATGKANLMRAMGNIRESSYETSANPNDLRLARNCYIAAAKFYQRLGK